MTDELSPEQEAAVRRLLSEARHDEPIPADVAARLDTVLDELEADEGVDDLEVFESALRHRAGRRPPPATEGRAAPARGGCRRGRRCRRGSDDRRQHVRRRRRRTRRTPRCPTLPEPATTPTRCRVRGQGGRRAGMPEPRRSPPCRSRPAARRSSTRSRCPSRSAPTASPLTSSDSWPGPRRTAARPPSPTTTLLSEFGYDAPAFRCGEGPYGEGAKLPAYYDAEEAVLVLRRPRAGIQRVDLLTCGTAVPLNSVDPPRALSAPTNRESSSPTIGCTGRPAEESDIHV